VVFALFSPKVTQASLQVQARLAAGARYKNFFRWRGRLPGLDRFPV
jgi:hypothetical protein